MLPVILFGAQVGLSILQGRESAKAAARQSAMAGFQEQLTIDRAVQEGAFAREGMQIGAERSILQAILTREQAATAAARRTEFSGPLERAAIRREAQFTERARRNDLAEALGAQVATFAASGAAGGRTQRLALARSQSQFAKEQMLRTRRTREALLVSNERDRAAELSADRATTAAGFQERAAVQDLRRNITASFVREGALIQNAQIQAQNTRAQAEQAQRQAKLNVLGSTLMAGTLLASGGTAGNFGTAGTSANNRPPDFRQY